MKSSIKLIVATIIATSSLTVAAVELDYKTGATLSINDMQASTKDLIGSGIEANIGGKTGLGFSVFAEAGTKQKAKELGITAGIAFSPKIGELASVNYSTYSLSASLENATSVYVKPSYSFNDVTTYLKFGKTFADLKAQSTVGNQSTNVDLTLAGIGFEFDLTKKSALQAEYVMNFGNKLNSDLKISNVGISYVYKF